jgi:magnesium chelatase family protein
VKGQENIKRALEIAAAGGHNVIKMGVNNTGGKKPANQLISSLLVIS